MSRRKTRFLIAESALGGTTIERARQQIGKTSLARPRLGGVPDGGGAAGVRHHFSISSLWSPKSPFGRIWRTLDKAGA
jgi:hypothetical protein